MHMSPAGFLSLISGMVRRRGTRIVRGSPTAHSAAADLLDEVAERWSCWRLRSESVDQYRHRLQLHLHTLAVAIEDDLALLDGLGRASAERIADRCANPGHEEE